jgi:hypothetical protein
LALIATCASQRVETMADLALQLRIPRISATQSTGMLPPSPEEFGLLATLCDV